MKNTLYVYTLNTIENLKNHFIETNIINVVEVLYKDKNDLINKDKFILDVTPLCYIADIDNLKVSFRIIEIKLYCLGVEFCVENSQLDCLLRKFPSIFDNKNYDFIENRILDNIQKTDEKSKFCQRLPIQLYNGISLDFENDINETIISISKMIDILSNSNFSFPNEKCFNIIKEYNIKLIDITSIMELFNQKKENIIWVIKILNIIYEFDNSIVYIINIDYKELLLKYFPFLFDFKDKLLVELDKTASNKTSLNSYKNIEKLYKSLSIQLRGHEDFKKDFEFNLNKYLFLNSIGEQKIFSVFLMGESGIGKTEFAKILSNLMYPSEKLIKINFGNYSTEGVLNSLIGSPIGFVGSNEGGELPNKIKNSKTKIVLIDEFEKATSNVFNFFYELLEDGKFTDRHGIEHNMDGYVIIFTSNMTKEMYLEKVPPPLNSRFDMVYCFVDLLIEEKLSYIIETSNKLISKIKDSTKVTINIKCVEERVDELLEFDNLRSMKKKVQDIIVGEYYNLIEK